MIVRIIGWDFRSDQGLLHKMTVALICEGVKNAHLLPSKFLVSTGAELKHGTHVAEQRSSPTLCLLRVSVDYSSTTAVSSSLKCTILTTGT